MAKLYFRYGTMGSAKTLNLLAVAHNYEQQNKAIYLVKPKVDNRYGEAIVQSRTGLKREADVLVEPETALFEQLPAGIACVLVDEAQFLSAFVVEQLRKIATQADVPVICYGLRTAANGRLFEGSKRLMELADTLEEVKTTCAFCHKKAIMNLRTGQPAQQQETPKVELGLEDKYQPACYACFCRYQHAEVPTTEQETTTQPA